jgi:hypothetical protein
LDRVRSRSTRADREYPEGMRTALVACGALMALVACGTGSAGSTQTTALTITYWESGVANGDPARWTLRCDPAGGTLARPGMACRRLAEVGRRVFTPVPRNAICTEIYGGPQVARVNGRLAGMRVWATFSRQNGCHISRWDRAAPWLLPSASAGAS